MKRLGLGTFRKRVIALGVGAALVPIITLGVVSYQAQKRVIENEFRVVLSSLAAESADQVSRWVSERRMEAETLARSPGMREETLRLLQLAEHHEDNQSSQYRLRQTLLRQSLELILLGYRWVAEASVIDPRTGRVVVSTEDGRIGAQLLGPDAMREILHGGTFMTPIYASKIELPNEGGVPERAMPTMDIAGLIGADSQLHGILLLRLNVLPMRKELLRGSRFFTASGMQSLDLYLIDNEGLFLSPSAFEEGLLADRRIIKRSILELMAREPYSGELTAAASSCQGLLTGSTNVPLSNLDGYRGYRGFPVVGAWTRVPGINWCVIAEVSEAEALAPVTNLLRVTLLVLLGVGGVFAFLAVGLSSTLTTPLTKLTSLATRMASGDRTVRFHMHRSDEIGQLGASFDQMAATIQQHVDDLEKKVQERTTNLLAANEELEREIKERSRAEQALAVTAQGLRDSEQKFRTLVENIPGAVYLSACDAEWTMEFLSDAIQEIAGYPAEDFLKNRRRTYMSLIHPEDRPLVDAAVHEALAAKRAFIVEYRIQHADGGLRWVYEKGQGVFDAEGRLLWRDGAFFDITERKRAQQRLAAQYAASRVLAEAASFKEAVPGILGAICRTLDWDMGLFWRVDYRSNRLRCMEVWTNPSMPFGEFDRISHEQEFAPGVGLPGEVWKTGMPVWVTDVAIRPTFPRSAVAASVGLHGACGFPVSTGTEILGVMEFFSRIVRQSDEEVLRMLAVTGNQIGQFLERVRAQEALQEREEQLRQAQKMEAVGRLAGGIAHDFNNVLTAIMGYSQLLLRKIEEDNPLRRYAVEIHQGGERAARLTGQLLAFSRKQVLQPKVLDLNSIVNGLDLMLHRLLGEQIRLETRLDVSLATVKADPGQLEQVILNLVVNSRDAMVNGGELRIETANVDIAAPPPGIHGDIKPGPYVKFSVIDTGTGMDADTLEHIFEPFFTTKGRDKGTGLGLATVYGIVRQSGGGVEVHSVQGQGTTFHVYLPAAVEPVEAPPAAPSGAEQPVQGSETILLVEDEDAVRSLAEQVLVQQGFTVLVARHGQEALRIAEQAHQRIHLLITDVVMPEMSGPEVAERLTARQTDMRVLYISGYTDNAIGDGGVLEAGTAYLAKPFSPDALLQKIREILDTPIPASSTLPV